MPDQPDASSNISGGMTTGEIRHVLAERDRFYLARIQALETRMVDFKDGADRALDLAKRANDKAGEQLADALVAYKAATNEWQATFREFRTSTLSRTETFAELAVLRTLIDKATERINEINRQHSRDSGSTDTVEAYRVQGNWRITVAVAITVAALGAVYFVINLIARG